MSETPSSGTPDEHVNPVDVAVAASTLAKETVLGATRRTAGVLSPVLRPAVSLALRPPLVPPTLQPQTWLDSLSRTGAEQREALVARVRQQVSDLLDVLVPLVVAEVLRRIDLTSLVIDNVDLEKIVEQVDPNDVAERVAVNAVAERVDLDAIVERLDLTEIVLTQVDLEAVIAAALDRIDLLSLATEVIDGVDLPAIIRESTGAMASDTVRGVRMQGIAADEAIGRAMDRLLLRRSSRQKSDKGEKNDAGAGSETSQEQAPDQASSESPREPNCHDAAADEPASGSDTPEKE